MQYTITTFLKTRQAVKVLLSRRFVINLQIAPFI